MTLRELAQKIQGLPEADLDLSIYLDYDFGVPATSFEIIEHNFNNGEWLGDAFGNEDIQRVCVLA